LSATPFDLIIGHYTIKQHHLVNRNPAYFGLLLDNTNDNNTSKEDDTTEISVPPKLTQVKAKTKSRSTSGNAPTTNRKEIIATGNIQPERLTISIKSLSESSKSLQAINLKRPRGSVEIDQHTYTAVQLFSEGHDGVPVEENPNMEGRLCAALERTYLCAGLIKTKEELLDPATVDDDEDDEISDMRHFSLLHRETL
jgi:hypothetical protein